MARAAASMLRVVSNASEMASARKATRKPASIAVAAKAADRPEKPYEVRADNPIGLLLRVQPSGRRFFYVQTGRGKRVRIGEAGPFTLEMAKTAAKKIIATSRSKASPAFSSSLVGCGCARGS